MKLKQKITATLLFGCIAAFVGATSLVLTSSTAGAIKVQNEDEICASTDIIPAEWTKTREACEQAVTEGKDPCAAMYTILEEDGNDAAQSTRKACQDAKATIPACVPGSDGCCGGVKTSIIGGDICGSEDGTAANSTIFNLLKQLLRIMTAGVGIAAVGGIAWGALLYTTAENKPEQTKKAIGIITNVAIGIVAYALMGVFLNFLIPGGVFN